MTHLALVLPTLAIIAIGVLTVVALINGFDGALLATSFSVIGGLAGYTYGTYRGKKIVDKEERKQ